MAVAPERKYQELGGPSVRQIARLLRDAISDAADRRTAQQHLFDALVFNVAMLGTDAHAKNYSVMLDQERVTLAPLYDLASHAAYPAVSGEPLTSAMSMDDVYRLDAIGERQFLSVARSLSIESDRAIDRVREITRGVSAAYAEAAARGQRICAAIVRRCRHECSSTWLGLVAAQCVSRWRPPGAVCCHTPRRGARNR